MSESTATATQVARQLARVFGMPNGLEVFAGFFAENGVFEQPYAMAGAASRWVGPAAIAAGVRATAAASRTQLEIRGAEVVTHQGADPALVVAEFHTYGVCRRTGADFRLPWAIGIIRVSEGKIISYRDYLNVIGAAAAAQVLPEFAAALS